MKRILALLLAALLLAACGQEKEAPSRAEGERPPGAKGAPKPEAPVKGEKGGTFRSAPGGAFGEGGR